MRRMRRRVGWVLPATGFVLITLVGAQVLSEYVGMHVFSWLLPGLLGAGSGELGSSVLHPGDRDGPGPAARIAVSFAAVVAPALAAAAAFPVSGMPTGPVGRWLPPVLAAAVGASALLALVPSRGGVTTGRRPRRPRPGSRRSARPGASAR